MPGSADISKNRKFQLRLINKVKNSLKNDDVFKDMCKECGVSIDVIDLIPVKFGPLEVSARTANAVITLNDNLLTDGRFEMIPNLLIHEIKHHIDQVFGDHATQGAQQGDYLRNEDEASAFKIQLEYMADHFGKGEAERYSEHLLDHHDKKGPERAELTEELLSKVDDGV